MNKIVLDSFAVMALLRKEAAYEKVKKIFKSAADHHLRVFISIINVAEVYYKVYRKLGKEQALRAISTLQKSPVSIVSASDYLVFKAAEVKANYSLALGDCFAAALALQEKASILTGDREFKKLEKIVKIKWL